MRAVAIISALVVAPVAATEAGWSWPWGTRTTTTTTTPTPVRSFEQGVAVALGLDDVSACAKDVGASFTDLKEGWADYKQGGIINKAKALAKIGEGIREIVEGFGGECAKGAKHGEKFLGFVKALKDPRFFTVHNALTLSLNLAEDRGQLSAFAEAMSHRNFFLAGETMTTTILTVLQDAATSGSNGTTSEQIAAGLAEGFVATFDIKVFHDVKVEVPLLAGGVIDLYSKVNVSQGLESLAQGLAGLAPALKDCLSERHEIAELLKEVADFRHPAALAQKWLQNMKDHGVDLALETASAILAFKGAEWRHFGKMVGEILEKLVVIRPTAAIVV